MGLLLQLPLPSLTTNDAQPYRECALAFTSMVTGNDDRPPLEPANLCDATIGDEFLESDTSLEITVLNCCILMQN